MKHIFLSILISFANISVIADDINKIASAYSTQSSDLQVSSSGTVIKLLSDDNEGSRHQRFILKLSNNQTVLVAHNIDLASKITSLRIGDVVEFNGEYEWNSKGGVIHWTHHDPEGRHQDGWLKHNGSIYE
jgi:molybdopterin converting factor small subunit